MIAKYGADALRMGLMVGTAIGNDIPFDENKVKGYKHFANKLWNITRFILSYELEGTDSKILPEDQKLLDELQVIIADVTKDFEEYRLYMAAEKLYHYVWDTLADVILEASKPILNGTDIPAKNSRINTLRAILEISLKTLHPFMPFVTEEIWSMMPNKKTLLMIESWPS
jgi:valyl-tRNA synthetase